MLREITVVRRSPVQPMGIRGGRGFQWSDSMSQDASAFRESLKIPSLVVQDK